MLRRFAIGEVYSEFYDSPTDRHRQESFCLLTSGNSESEIEGIKRVLARRAEYVNSVPDGTRWYLAKLTISEKSFSDLRTINEPEWVRRSRGTKKLIDAAFFIRDCKGLDQRIDSIISGFKKSQVEMVGITLFGSTREGPFTIVEGTGRLIAVFLCYIAELSSLSSHDELEVVLGLSTTQWVFS